MKMILKSLELMMFYMLVVLPLIMSVAYYTLAERKMMAALQSSHGPKMVGFWGLLQPIVDGLKLMLKELVVPASSNSFLFMLSPVLVASLSFTSWTVMPFSPSSVITDVNFGLIFIFMLSSLNVYGLMLAGWSSNSKYALLGALRAISQMISYEIVLGFSVFIVVYFSKTANLTEMVLQQSKQYNFLPLLPVSIIFFILIFAETNSAPFDLPEAESEIVAGYNVEYSSITFAMFFLAEYSNMMLMSVLWVLLFFGGWLAPIEGNYYFLNWLMMKTLFLLIMFVVMSAVLPSYRFDQLIWMGWQCAFPILVSYFMMLSSMFMICGMK